MKRPFRAISKERWRATAAERRRYGGSTVTEFYVTRTDTGDTKLFIGYGKTPGERKTFALKKAEAFWWPEGPMRQVPNRPSRYYVWLLQSRSDSPLSGEGPYGPLSLESATTFARVGATEGKHDRVVTEGPDPATFKVRRRYEAGTGKTLLRA